MADYTTPPCPECGHDELEDVLFGHTCPECDWDDVNTPETPEGGWPRGSDMDRL